MSSGITRETSDVQIYWVKRAASNSRLNSRPQISQFGPASELILKLCGKSVNIGKTEEVRERQSIYVGGIRLDNHPQMHQLSEELRYMRRMESADLLNRPNGSKDMTG